MMDAEREELLAAQHAFCKARGAPMFMPGSGRCWHCGADMVDAFGDRLRTEIITGCPHCFWSYCD